MKRTAKTTILDRFTAAVSARARVLDSLDDSPPFLVVPKEVVESSTCPLLSPAPDESQPSSSMLEAFVEGGAVDEDINMFIILESSKGRFEYLAKEDLGRYLGFVLEVSETVRGLLMLVRDTKGSV